MDLKYLGFLIQGAVLGVSAATMPGMFQTMLISETLIGGYKRSFPIAFVPLLSDFPIILLTLIVLKQLPPVFTRLMSMAGGGYVIYLAWGLIRQWKSGVSSEYGECDNSVRPWVLMRRVVLMNFLNPNPYLFWGLVGGPILLTALKQSVLYAVFFIFGMYSVFISILIILIVIFHFARRLGSGIVKYMLLTSIIVLFMLGCALIFKGAVL